MKKLFATCFFIFVMLLLGSYSYAETVSISGKITQFSSTGMSLNDIVINVKGTKNTQVKTGRTGSYIVSGLPKGGSYTLTASKPGYTFQPANKVFRNLDESKVSQDFVAELASYSISGKVIVGGRPVRGVLITINNRPIKYYTDQDGKYVIDNLEYNGGPYEVSVVSDKHIFEPFKIDSLESDVEHDFRKDISISGRVTSLGQGLGGIEIDVNGTKYKTDDDGYYKVDSVISNGDYVVKVVEEKYNPVPSSVPLKKITSDKYDVNFSLSGQLIGKVTFNGQPFKNAIITVSDREQEYKTNAQGMFNVPNLGLNQYYQISLSSAGYKFTPNERIINCLMRESGYQNFKAEIEKHSITISVNQGKQPIENVEINVNNTVYKTDKNGVCVIKDLNYGKKYTITAKKQGITFVESKKVIDKLQGDDRVSFESKLSISGKVLNKVHPLKDAIIICGDKKVVTDVNGEYILKNLMPSHNYTLKVSSSNFEFNKNEIEIENLYDNLKNVDFLVSTDKKEKEELERREQELKQKAEAELKAKEELEQQAKEEKEKSELEAKQKAEAEKQAKIEAAKAEQARMKAEKEEAERKAKEEKIRLKLEAEEAARKAKEEREREIAAAKAEQARIKAEKEEAARKAKEEKEREIAAAKAKAEAEKQAKIEAAKAEQARIKAEKEEAERKAKEEKIRLKLEAEEAARKAKEEKEREIAAAKAKAEAEKQAKIKAAEEAKAKAEAEKKAKEEQARLDAEIKRLELEEKAKEEFEAKQKAEAEKQAKIEAAKAEQARIKAEKEEAARKAKEEKEREIAAAKAKAEAEKQAKIEAAKAEQARIKAEKEEAERKAKEEKIRLKLEAEEAARKAKEEKEREIAAAKAKAEAEKQAKIKAAEEAKAKAEAEKKAKEEQARLDAEVKRLELEKKAKEEFEARQKAEAEKQAKIEAAKAEQARIKAEKEEAERKAKEEKIRLKLEAEEAARKAKEEKEREIAAAKAKAEAEKKEKEEQARLEAEVKRLELEKKAKEEFEARQKAEAEKQAKIEAAKAEQARIKAEKEEAEKKAKEEKEREIAAAKAKAEAEKKEKEEQARLEAEVKRLELEKKAKEEFEAKQKAEAEKQAKIEAAKAEQARIKAEKEEAERKAKEEKIRLKLEAEEAARKAKEEKEREIAAAKAKAEAEAREKAEAERQEKIRAEEAAKKSKAQKEDLLKKSKEEAFGNNKLKESVAIKGYTGLESGVKLENKENNDENIYIEGRVLRGKLGVKSVQVRLILEDEEKIFLTDKNGYYKIPELEKGKNYLITVLSGKETLNLSPKSRTYKNLSTNMTKQNFYVIEATDSQKEKTVSKKQNDKTIDEQEWNKKYGFENKDGLVQKDIHW